MTTPSDQKPINKSIEDVARDVLNTILVTSIKSRKEYGGMIYLIQGGYKATAPRTQDYGNSVDVGIHEKNMSCPENSKPVAMYHTHPNMSSGSLKMAYNEMLDNDITLPHDNKIDSYVGTVDGSFLKYDWNTGKTTRLKGRLKNTD